MTAGTRSADARADALAAGLAVALKNISFYDVEHRVVLDVLVELHSSLTGFLQDAPELVLKFVDGYVVADDRPLLTQRASLGNLVGACHRRDVEAITFEPGVTLPEIRQLVRALAADPETLAREGGVDAALTAQGIVHIAVERLKDVSERDWRLIHAAALDVLRNATAAVRTGGLVDIAGLRKSVRSLLDNLSPDGVFLGNLLTLKDTDEYTFIHALHVCVFACELGRELGLPREELETLGLVTALHDVGKVFVPLAILRKPAALDDAELAAMKRHPVDGAVSLSRDSRLPDAAAVVAFEHHMQWDFAGYPKVNRPRRLHLYSLLANLADIYDALTTTRPYRPALPPRRALLLMQEEIAPHLEPRLLQHFLALAGPYPWGTLLRAPEGRLAVVTRPNREEPDNPRAREVVTGEGRARFVGPEGPVRELFPVQGRLDDVDPVDVALDLTTLMRELRVGPDLDAPLLGARRE